MRPLALFLAASLTVLSCGRAELPAAGPAEPPADPSFLAIPLTDVRTGEQFTLGGFPGKVTFFLAMAVW
ncbi:MAG: hypothetical protein ACRDGT_01115 [Candidatus Limnocylindria bacterium]